MSIKLGARSYKLFLGFLMLRVSAAPAAILLELYLALDKFLVLARPVVGAIALGAAQFDELILGHRAAL